MFEYVAYRCIPNVSLLQKFESIQVDIITYY